MGTSLSAYESNHECASTTTHQNKVKVVQSWFNSELTTVSFLLCV